MTLHVDQSAKRNLAGIIGALRSARLSAEVTQNALSEGLPVRGRAISEWETGAIEPTLGHLIQWSRVLNLRLVIAGWETPLPVDAVSQRRVESAEILERRRLAWSLRSRRFAMGMTQEDLCRLVGVSRDSIQRWELLRVPPRPIAHIVWAQKLGCSIALRPMVAVREH